MPTTSARSRRRGADGDEVEAGRFERWQGWAGGHSSFLRGATPNDQCHFLRGPGTNHGKADPVAGATVEHGIKNVGSATNVVGADADQDILGMKSCRGGGCIGTDFLNKDFPVRTGQWSCGETPFGDAEADPAVLGCAVLEDVGNSPAGGVDGQDIGLALVMGGNGQADNLASGIKNGAAALAGLQPAIAADMGGEEGAQPAFDVESLDETDNRRAGLVIRVADGNEHRAGLQFVGVTALEEWNFFAGVHFQDGEVDKRINTHDAGGNFPSAPVNPAFLGRFNDRGRCEQMSFVIHEKPGADAHGRALGKDGLSLGLDADNGVAAAFIERADFAVHGFELAGRTCRSDGQQAERDCAEQPRNGHWPSHNWPG